jgi:hypothetical protein
MAILRANRTGSWSGVKFVRAGGRNREPGVMEINGINFVTNVAVEIQLGVVTFEGSTSGDLGEQRALGTHTHGLPQTQGGRPGGGSNGQIEIDLGNI